MTYHLSVDEVINEINQVGDTPPFPKLHTEEMSLTLSIKVNFLIKQK
ncbi:MAG: hypothetical protein ACTS7E_05045 [Arsenophonus sp. NC-CH8-MAG3]